MKTVHTFIGVRLMAVLSAGIFGAISLQAQGDTYDKSLNNAYSLAVANNQVYIGGHVRGALPGFTDNGNYDAFVQAYDQNGNLLWSAQFGSSAEDEINGVAADSTGVYVAGYTEGTLPGQTSSGKTDFVIAKYDLSGNLLWLHQYGGPGIDRWQAATSDGTYLYVVGYSTSALWANPNQGLADCVIEKINQNGHLIWTKEFGTPQTDRAYGVAVTATNLYVSGRTDGAFPGYVSSGGIDAFLAEFDLDGNMIWLDQYGSPADDRGWEVDTDATGVFVTGRTEGALPGQVFLGSDDAFIAKFGFDGTNLWIKQYGTQTFDRGTTLAHDSTGVYNIGYTEGALPGFTNQGSADVFVRKFDDNGNVIWTTQFGSTAFDSGWGIGIDSTGVYISGAAGGSLPYQSGTPATKGFFLGKMDTNGNVLWIKETTVHNPKPPDAE